LPSSPKGRFTDAGLRVAMAQPRHLTIVLKLTYSLESCRELVILNW